MKFYEGSLGDKMAHLPGNKLPLGDVLRFAETAYLTLLSCGIKYPGLT